MKDLVFFCLAAKVRQAQKAYYAYKPKDEQKQKLLERSKQLEKILDDEIKTRIDNATKEDKKEMAIEWGNFVYMVQILHNIYL